MAISTESKILSALINRLLSLTFSPALPIAMPNVAFAPEEHYLIADIFMNQTRRITLGDDPQQRRGIFQVTVVWSRGVGLIKPLDVAGAVVEHFSHCLTLWEDDIKITIGGSTLQEPSAISPMIEADRLLVPVSIPFFAFEPEV